MEVECEDCLFKDAQHIEREHESILSVHWPMRDFPQDQTKRNKRVQ